MSHFCLISSSNGGSSCSALVMLRRVAVVTIIFWIKGTRHLASMPIIVNLRFQIVKDLSMIVRVLLYSTIILLRCRGLLVVLANKALSDDPYFQKLLHHHNHQVQIGVIKSGAIRRRTWSSNYIFKFAVGSHWAWIFIANYSLCHRKVLASCPPEDYILIKVLSATAILLGNVEIL